MDSNNIDQFMAPCTRDSIDEPTDERTNINERRLSFARWFMECLYVEETVRMSDAWRMPPPFYNSPSKESVLLGLESMAYVEGSTTSNVVSI